MTAQDKIMAAVEICGTYLVWDKLDRFKRLATGFSADSMLVKDDGSIYLEDDGRFLNDSELDDFTEWCRGENLS